MNQYRSGFLSNVPPMVKYILVINVAMLLISRVAGDFMYSHFAMYYPGSPLFEPHQLITHIFMHGGFFHLLFNMYALWLFGCSLEYQWRSKKFLLYYMLTGVGAALFYAAVLWLQVRHAEAAINPEMLAQMKNLLHEGRILTNVSPEVNQWNVIMNTPMVGASGAVYGVLLAFGMLYPNTQLRFIFPPVAIRAKWLVVLYGGLALLFGFTDSGGNIAHFAHVGGMLFGFILIKYWQKKGRMYS